jgi:hypothetical protein
MQYRQYNTFTQQAITHTILSFFLSGYIYLFLIAPKLVVDSILDIITIHTTLTTLPANLTHNKIKTKKNKKTKNKNKIR